MFSFKEFLTLVEDFDIQKTDQGSHVYTSKVGDTIVRTHFNKLGKSELGRYEIGVTRQGPKDKAPVDALKGRTNISHESRLGSVMAVNHHIRHFIKGNNPYELNAKGNTKEKRSAYRPLFDALSRRHEGSEVSHSKTGSNIRFKPTPEQEQKVSQIKQSNLSAIKAAIQRKKGSTMKESLRQIFISYLEEKSPAWQRSAGKDPKGGLNKKGVESYRREHPGSKLQTAVTTEPSKLAPDSKKAKRRKSFCSRMKGMKSKLTSAKTARDPDSRINKSLRKWNC